MLKPSLGRIVFFVLFFSLTIVALAGISALTGPLDLTVGDVYTAVLHKFFPDRYEPNWIGDVVIWNIRLPRILMSILTGISLGIAGATMQWALKNPFASPYTLGISSVTACGASIAILFGMGSIGVKFLIIGVAGISALIATAIILYISSRRWATPGRVILMGIVIMIFSNAITTKLMYFSDVNAVRNMVFWMMVGDFSPVSWTTIAYMAGIIVLCGIPLFLLIFLLSLFGVNDRCIRTSAMVAASLLAATTVCFTGTIGFIGLLAPHICRLAIGADYRFVIPISGLIGAVLLLVLDLVARTVLSPVILPVGVLTAWMVVPLLVYLIVREGIMVLTGED